MLVYGFQIDVWTIWGLASQGVFFSRFALQWYLSEKHKRIVVPHAFWTISVVGAIMTMLYAWVRRDAVILLATILQVFIFGRSWMISKNGKVESE